MLPKRLSEASYYSYAVGKWHQGSAYREWTPVGRGFDESYGFLGGGEDHFTQQTGTCRYNASNGKTTRGGVTDYWEETAGSPGRHITDCDIPAETAPACPLHTVLNLNGSKADNLKRCAAGEFVNCAVPKKFRTADATLTDTDPETFQCYQCKKSVYTGYDFNDKAVEMIRTHTAKHSTRPLFMYLALHNTHGPIEAPAEWEAIYSHLSFQKQITFDAMVSVVDSTVGNVTSMLKQQGMWKDTLFIWTTGGQRSPQLFKSSRILATRRRSPACLPACLPACCCLPALFRESDLVLILLQITEAQFRWPVQTLHCVEAKAATGRVVCALRVSSQVVFCPPRWRARLAAESSRCTTGLLRSPLSLASTRRSHSLPRPRQSTRSTCGHISVVRWLIHRELSSYTTT